MASGSLKRNAMTTAINDQIKAGLDVMREDVERDVSKRKDSYADDQMEEAAKHGIYKVGRELSS